MTAVKTRIGTDVLSDFGIDAPAFSSGYDCVDHQRFQKAKPLSKSTENGGGGRINERNEK